MKLSILICHIPERREMLNLLLDEFQKQSRPGVEVLVDPRRKGECSVGTKRQALLEKSMGEWIVFFDDDDWPNTNYINLIFDHMGDYDCMGINGTMTTNGGMQQTWCHSLGYDWSDGSAPVDGWDYVRPIIHFNPVLREKALLVGFNDLRFGEDRDYSDRLNKLLYKENFIEEPLFHYRYSNQTPHHVKYGLPKPGRDQWRHRRR